METAIHVFLSISFSFEKIFILSFLIELNYRYKDGDVLGYPVEMTWFRDIRRYVSYQQSQGNRLLLLIIKVLDAL